MSKYISEFVKQQRKINDQFKSRGRIVWRSCYLENKPDSMSPFNLVKVPIQGTMRLNKLGTNGKAEKKAAKRAAARRRKEARQPAQH